MKQANAILELQRVFTGMPTENFQPSKGKLKPLARDFLDEAEYMLLRPLLEQAYSIYRLRYFALFFYYLISNYQLVLADEDLNVKMRLLRSNAVFVRNYRSCGFYAISSVLNTICENYEAQVVRTYSEQQFEDMQDFLLFSRSAMRSLASVFEDLEFVTYILVNICPTLDTVVELRNPPEFDVVAAFMKLPTLLNYAYKYSMRLSVERRAQFEAAWSRVLLRHYAALLTQYMKFGHCNDNFEFFAQDGDFDSKAQDFNLNQVNFVYVEAPGCVLYPKLFPYFISEETAREIVFIARVAKITRFQRKTDEALQQLVQLLDRIEVEFDNPLEFDLTVYKLKMDLSVYIYIKLLAPCNVLEDTTLFLQIALMQNSALIVNFLACAQQYITYPFRFAQETAYQQLLTRKSSFVETELNQIFDLEAGQQFGCFKLKNVGNENQILADAQLTRFYIKTDGHYFFDLDAYYFGVEKSAILKGFGAYKAFGLLFDYLIYDYQWRNEPSALLLSPYLKCSFSRIMRNLLYIKHFYTIFTECTAELLALRRFYSALDKFRCENPHFMRFNQYNSSVGCQISSVLRIFRLANLFHVSLNEIYMHLDMRIKEAYEKFHKVQKLDFLSLYTALIELASATSAAVLLNEKPASLLMCSFFDYILYFVQLIADSKPFFAAYARYGKADERLVLFYQRVDLCYKKTKEVSDSLTTILGLR